MRIVSCTVLLMLLVSGFLFARGNAHRVVSLTPATTEILFALGAADSVVGVTDFCDYPADAKTKQSVGGFSAKTVSVERIASLHPDLVILSEVMHERLIPVLSRMGIPVLALEPRSFEDVFKGILLIGERTGRGAEAVVLVDSLRKRLASVESSVSGKSRPRVFWELWNEPLMTAGGTTFVSEALEKAGAVNVFSDLKEDWPSVSIEQVWARKPDWILATDPVAVNLEQLRKMPLWSSLDAVRQGRVALVNADIISRGGPRLVDAVETIARLIH